MNLSKPKGKNGKTYYNVPDLQKLIQPFLELVTNHPVRIQMQNTTQKEALSVFSFLQKKGNRPKADWLYLGAFFLAEKRNMSFYVSTLSDTEVVAWKLILRNLYANNRMLKNATGKDWICRKESWGYYYDYTPCQEASWFTMAKSASDKLDRHGYYREKDVYFFLRIAFRKLFAPPSFSRK